MSYPTRYDIRVERPDHTCRDFAVTAWDLDRARVKAEDEIQKDFPMQSLRYDWRGLVVFVSVRAA